MRFLVLGLIGLSFCFTVSAEEEASSSSEYQHLLGVSLNSSRATFDDGDSNGTRFESEYNFDSALGFGYEARKSAQNDWGHAFGAEYIAFSQLDDFEFDVSDGSSVRGVGDDNEGFSALVLTANLIYQWEKFYIPFGVNYMSISNGDDLEFKGGFGFNFGLGWQFTDKFFLELMGKSNLVEGEIGELDLGDGILSVSSINFKYNFF